jgi:hypothetical protein
VIIPVNLKLGCESTVLSRGETRKNQTPIDRKRYQYLVLPVGCLYWLRDMVCRRKKEKGRVNSKKIPKTLPPSSIFLVCSGGGSENFLENLVAQHLRARHTGNTVPVASTPKTYEYAMTQHTGRLTRAMLLITN